MFGKMGKNVGTQVRLGKRSRDGLPRPALTANVRLSIHACFSLAEEGHPHMIGGERG